MLAASLLVALILLGITAWVGASTVQSTAPRVNDVVEYTANLFRPLPVETPLLAITPLIERQTPSATSGIAPAARTVATATPNQTVFPTPTPARVLAYEPARLKDTL